MKICLVFLAKACKICLVNQFMLTKIKGVVVPNTRHRFHTQEYTSEFVTLSPADAELLVTQFNPHNRKRSKVRISRYANEMKKGAWKDYVAVIMFNIKGNMINGQHTLLACAKAKVPIKVVVISGYPYDAMEGIDRGGVRTLSDILELKGKESSRMAVKTCNWLAKVSSGTPSKKPLDSDVIATAEKRAKGVAPVIEMFSKQARHRWQCFAGFLAAAVEYYERDPVRATAFFKDFLADMGPSINPARKLYVSFQEWSKKKQHPGKYGKASYELAVACFHFHRFNKAWPADNQVAPTSDWTF